MTVSVSLHIIYNITCRLVLLVCLSIIVSKNSSLCAFVWKAGAKVRDLFLTTKCFRKFFWTFFSGGWLHAPKGLIPSRSLSPAKVDIGCRILYKGETLLRLSHQVSHTLFQCRISLDCGCKSTRFQHNCQTYHLIFLTLFWNLFVTCWFTTTQNKDFLKTTEQEGNRTHIIILRARMYAHVEGYGSSDKCIVLIVHRRYVEFKKLWGSICYCCLLFLWIHRKRGRKISSNREIPKMACRAMTESIKITAFFRPTSGNLFLPSSFHLLLKRPADGGFGCERTSFHPPFSLLSSVKLLPAFELFR